MENFQFNDKFASENIISIPNPHLFQDESKMEVVKAFNNELVSLYDIKPPISKAKMTAITKAAMKSVKFYKHVVHGVEKFILKCRPDYKIPGLYVIDSIVRQSRHQFGVEKDVFAPRFSKNLLQTFKNICTCPEDDKQKLVRVINLWQKHKVFPDDLLKKFLVMAEAGEDELPTLYNEEIEAIQKSSKKSPSSGKKKKKSPAKTGLDATLQNSFYSTNAMNSTPRMDGSANKNSLDPNFIQSLQTLTNLLQQSSAPTSASPATGNATPGNDQVKFDRKLLDYDYGEEDEDGPSTQSAHQPAQSADNLSSLLTNPEIIRHIHNLQVQLSMAQVQAKPQDAQLPSIMEHQRMFQNQQMQAFNQALMQQQQAYLQNCNPAEFYASGMQNMDANAAANDDDLDDKPEIVMEKTATEPLEVIDLDHIATPPSDKSRGRSYSRSRSRSRSRTPSRSRRGRRRTRSRSWNRDRSRDRERNEDRRRRALPPIKRKHLAVCSTTLWVGHLSKLVQEQDLSDTFGEFGDIVSIDLIPPRGCAFLCMNRRQDAYRALHKLKNTKLHGKSITIAWAPGKGMKGREWKDYWEVDYGVSYIPWNKLTPDTDYDLLEEGGVLDQETMPEWLKNKRKVPYGAKSGPHPTSGSLMPPIPFPGTGAAAASSKALYTPTGTDMDESSNDGDDMQRSHSRASNDMIIESQNGVPEQMIPLPDGPQPMVAPNPDIPPPLGIPLPPQTPGSLPPPPNLLNPFGLPPRLLTPMGVLGGNFLPPLGVPPPVPGLLMSPQQMLNRLPPPFNTGPPGLPMLNPGPNPNTSLSQIPLPDSASNLVNVTSGMPPNTDFKPPPFGLTPPLLFPGNPNFKIDLPGNPNMNMPTPPNPNDMSSDTSSVDSANPFANAFPSLMQSFGKNPMGGLPGNTIDKDDRGPPGGGGGIDNSSIDTDYRLHRGGGGGSDDISNSNNSSQLNNSFTSENGANDSDNNKSHHHHHHDREDFRHRGGDRYGGGEFGRGGDRDHRHYDRNPRLFDKDRSGGGGGVGDKYHNRDRRGVDGRSPYRESNYDMNDRYNKYDRLGGMGPGGAGGGPGEFRRNRYDSRDFSRGGRDFPPRGGGRPPRDMGPMRPRGRSPDRYRDRRDYGGGGGGGGGMDNDKNRRFEKRGRSRDKTPPENTHHNGKRSRWGDKVTTDQPWASSKPAEDWNKPEEDNWNKREEPSWDKPAGATTTTTTTAPAATNMTSMNQDAWNNKNDKQQEEENWCMEESWDAQIDDSEPMTESIPIPSMPEPPLAPTISIEQNSPIERSDDAFEECRQSVPVDDVPEPEFEHEPEPEPEFEHEPEPEPEPEPVPELPLPRAPPAQRKEQIFYDDDDDDDFNEPPPSSKPNVSVTEPEPEPVRFDESIKSCEIDYLGEDLADSSAASQDRQETFAAQKDQSEDMFCDDSVVDNETVAASEAEPASAKNEQGGVLQMADDVRIPLRRPGQQQTLNLYDDEANDANAADAPNAALPLLDTNRSPAPALGPASLFQNSIQLRFREPRIMFQNRGMLGRAGPPPHFGGPRFGGGGGGGGGAGPGHFPRPPPWLQGHRPPPPFFAAPPAPRHVRPFMSPRSSSF
ncbi:SR-related and CTD-associated factor 4 isoform X2 [Planococcus citri]|uniref:SR-related and CTD-associated factor 4 isoform X2 n=1 Tax=Planococcus citri TaxID=170843 RepID=UPI0031F95679